jgi:hypothetical protein
MIAVMFGRMDANIDPHSQTESVSGVNATGIFSPLALAKAKPDFEKNSARTKQSPRIASRSIRGLACSYSPAELQKNKTE